MRSLRALLVLLVPLVGCAGPTPTAPRATPPAPQAAPASEDAPALASPLASHIPGADHPRVRESFPDEIQRTLRHAEQLELFGVVCERDAFPGETTIRGYPIVSTAQVSGATRDAVLADVYRGVIEGNAFAMCFEPHHALRAVDDGLLVEVVICFECSQLYVYRNGTESGYATISAAARAGLDRLLEPVPGSVVAGRSLDAWIDHFGRGVRRDALEPAEAEAVVALAEPLETASPRYVDLACSALSELGPLAAPALPSVRRALVRQPPAVVDALVDFVVGLGRAGASAVPELVAAYDRDYSAFVLGDDPTDAQLADPSMVEADAVDDLRFAILAALTGLGPRAEPARALALRLASSDEPTLADAGAALLAALGGDATR